MYEILIKWTLDTLTKLTDGGLQYEESVLLEALKAKNQLVLERVKIALSINEKILALSAELENELEKYIKENSDKQLEWDLESYLNNFKRDFHPDYFRRFRKLANQFSSTSDLLLAYAMVLVTDWIHYDNFEKIVKARDSVSFSDACRIYRIIWDYTVSFMNGLIRISANDLRFWLTDSSYLTKAVEWAEHDIERARNFMIDYDGSEKYFYLSLEQQDGTDTFWKQIES
jgi:hypothetical protein